jgi:hypothetical protein
MKHHIPFLTALCCLEQAAGADPADWRDLAAAFRDPPNAFRVVQYGAHEGAAMPIARMRDYGIGGVMLFLSKHRYLRNDDAWENMKANIRLAKEAGMQVWVADDNGYPSGMAGGLVAEADPAFENRGILPLVRRGQGPQDVRIDLPPKAEDFVSAMVYPERDGQPAYASGVPARVAGRQVESAGLEGPWVLYAFARQIINEGTQATSTAQPFATNGRYRRQERCLYFIVNRTAERLAVPLSSATTSSIVICDPITGAMEAQSLPLNLEIGAYQSRLAVDPNPPPGAPPGTGKLMPWQKPLPARVSGIPNLARQAIASASSTHPNPAYSVYDAVDGNKDAGDWQHWCNADDAPATPAKPAWLMLEWPQPQTVRRAVLTFMKDYTVSDYELEYREQGKWEPFGAAQVQGNASISREHVVAAPIATDAIRFLGRQGPVKQPTIVRVVEIEVFER